MTDPTRLKEVLVALETERTRAWLERDRARLEALLDDGFVEINSVGRLDRRRVLEELFPSVRLVALEPADYVLLPAGDGAALLTYRCTETIEIGGKTIAGAFHVGALYVRRAGGWKLCAWQITPSPEGR